MAPTARPCHPGLGAAGSLAAGRWPLAAGRWPLAAGRAAPGLAGRVSCVSAHGQPAHGQCVCAMCVTRALWHTWHTLRARVGHVGHVGHAFSLGGRAANVEVLYYSYCYYIQYIYFHRSIQIHDTHGTQEGFFRGQDQGHAVDHNVTHADTRCIRVSPNVI